MGWLDRILPDRHVTDCLFVLGALDEEFEEELGWPVLKGLAAEALKSNKKTVAAGILRDGKQERDIVLTLLANIALNEVGSGRHHIYRGHLSMVGNSLRVMFSSIVSLQKLQGALTADERDQALLNLNNAVSEAG